MSRRSFLRHSGAALAAGRLGAAAAGPAQHAAGNVPTRRATYQVVFKSPGLQPNGLQAALDGLWILDQQTNEAAKVRYQDGRVITRLATTTDRGSGLTLTETELWIASTYTAKLVAIDPATGRTLREYETPGAGAVHWGGAGSRPVTGAHGMEYVHGRLWVAVPPAIRIFQLDPRDLSILHTIPAPDSRPHGLAWDNGVLWCAESNHKAVYKMDPGSGALLERLQLPEDGLTPHGMTMTQGELWFCCAETGDVCRMIL